MRSIIGQCAECCECPPAIVRSATVSASRSKCGFPEWAGHISTPPKIYRRMEYSGAQTYSLNDSCIFGGTCDEELWDRVDNVSFTYSGYFSFNSACELQNNSVKQRNCSERISEVCGEAESCTDNPISTPYVYSTSYPPDIVATSTLVTFSELPFSPDLCRLISQAETRQIELVDEYLTATLITELDADLAAETYPDKIVGAPSAFFLKTEDETGASAEESKYEVAHKVPKFGSGKCFKAYWVERFTPDDEGDPVDVEKSYTWDGVTPEGYDPEDPTTYPKSSEFILTRPTSEGGKTIGYYTDPDDPDTFVEGYVLTECRGCA